MRAANGPFDVRSPALRRNVSLALLAAFGFGVYALGVSAEPSVKCLGLVAAFFAPV